MKTTIKMAIAITFAASASMAQDAAKTSVGLGISTYGPKIEGTYRINDRFGVRGFIAGGVSKSGDTTQDGVKYTGKAKLGGVGVLMDYYPGQSGFRISGGLINSQTSVTGSATGSATNPITIGANTYTSDTVNGTIGFKNKINPVVAIGYDLSMGNRWMLSADLGAVATGGVKATLTSATIPVADLNAEVANIQNSASGKVVPYLSLVASMRF